jgi:deoxyxylulose-5-phosphate synthase
MNRDVEIIYTNSVNPFDQETITKNCGSSKVLIVEPFYEGTMSHLVLQALENRAVQIRAVGIKREFITNYGDHKEISEVVGFTPENLLKQFEILCNS